MLLLPYILVLKYSRTYSALVQHNTNSRRQQGSSDSLLLSTTFTVALVNALKSIVVSHSQTQPTTAIVLQLVFKAQILLGRINNSGCC